MHLSAQAFLSIDPDVYFLLSGTGQARNYPGMAWGNGFVTNQTLIQQYPALLPINEIEPALVGPYPVCMELPVPEVE